MSSVNARRSQFEANQQQQQQNKKNKKAKAIETPETSDEETEDEDEAAFDFADLVRALTGGAEGGPGEIDALQETFKILDCDGDGFITLPDLRSAMNGFQEVGADDNADEEEDGANNPDDEELREMIAAADDCGNGKISFKSFVNIIDPKLAQKSFPATVKGSSNSRVSRVSLARQKLEVANK